MTENNERPDWQEILTFWFDELDESRWWKKDVTLDREIDRRFGDVHRRALRCELFDWRRSAAGRLAEIIVLDQFSRNLFRDSREAFAADPMALALSQEAIAAGADQALAPVQRVFLYLPFMHSESLKIHEIALELYASTGLSGNLDFERQHKAIIERFGRYPHRNKILGRESSQAELDFLKEPGSSF